MYDLPGFFGDNDASRFDRFKFSWLIAHRFYIENRDGAQCVNSFWGALKEFCEINNTGYEKEFFSNGDSKGYNIRFTPGMCGMSLMLNAVGEPECVVIRAWAFKYIKEIRNSIWDTKTLFGLPVLSVLHQDEDFINNPRNFIVTIMPRETANDPSYNF